MTALSGSPPRYTPTIHANASDTTPMFTLVTMLSVTATNSAASEIQAIGIYTAPFNSDRRSTAAWVARTSAKCAT